MDAIREHNYFTELNQKLNKIISKGLGMAYFCGTSGVHILLHLSIYSENSYISLFYIPYIIQILIIIFIFNLVLSEVSTAAHKITSYLHKFLATKYTTKIPLNRKFELLLRNCAVLLLASIALICFRSQQLNCINTCTSFLALIFY